MPGVARKQYVPGIELTPMQREFVRTVVKNGCSATKAAEIAGFKTPRQTGHYLQALPHVQAAIRIERQRYIVGELANVATGTLVSVMTDKEAPASARVQAARTVLEMSGELAKGRGKADDEDRPLSELTADELTRLIDRWTEEKAALAKPIEAEDVQILDSAQAMAQVRS
jgi:hypothetical protein